jgi:hypothetical protein
VTTSTTSTSSTTRTDPRLLQGLRVTAVLTVLNVAYQSVTAGQLLGVGAPVALHAAGAVTLHAFSGLAAIAAVLLWRRGGAPAWLAALAVVSFVLTFVQAALGGYETLDLHIPGAMVLTVAAVWLAVASWGPAVRR